MTDYLSSPDLASLEKQAHIVGSPAALRDSGYESLGGKIGPGVLLRALARQRLDGSPLSQRKGKRHGHEFVISVDKTVSVAAFCGNEASRKAVLEALDRAKLEAVRHWFAALPSQPLAMLFTHEANRMGEPHWHTHGVVPNLAHSIYGYNTVSQFESPFLKTMGATDLIFQSVLANELRTIGFDAKVEKGNARIPSLAKEAARLSSPAKRIADLKTKMAPKEAFFDWLNNRPKKETRLDMDKWLGRIPVPKAPAAPAPTIQIPSARFSLKQLRDHCEQGGVATPSESGRGIAVLPLAVVSDEESPLPVHTERFPDLDAIAELEQEVADLAAHESIFVDIGPFSSIEPDEPLT